MTRFLTPLILLLLVLLGNPTPVSAQETTSPAVAEAVTAMDTRTTTSSAHAEHAEEEHAHAPELPTVIHIINSLKVGDKTFGHTPTGKFLRTFEKQIYLLFWTSVFSLIFFKALSLAAMKPGKVQATIEMLVEGLSNFFTGIVGKDHIKHVPFLCSLFLFIWLNNLTSLVPGFAPATGIYQTGFTLAIIVLIYFVFHGIKEGGLGHFLWHLAGSPRDAIGWAISPAMFVLEIVGTLAKPLSLSLRLYGNIMGEDILLGVFLLLGVLLAGAFVPDPIIGFPLHLPFMFLVLLGCTIQALVFSLLSAIYLAMVLPHHDEEGHHNTDGEEHPLLPGANKVDEESGSVDAGVVPFV